MSFFVTLSWLQAYRLRHSEGLNNQKRMAWSTSEASTVSDFFSKIDPKQENDDWNGIYHGTPSDTRKTESAGIKLAFMARLARDVRHQYRSAWIVDADRHEYNLLATIIARTDWLGQVIHNKDLGVKKTT